MALARADVNRKTDITRERMFLGAFVKAYSRPVIEAKISLIAINMYLADVINQSNYLIGLSASRRGYSRSALDPDIERRDVVACCSTITARTSLVNIMLKDSSPDHGCCGSEETECNPLDWAKNNFRPAEDGINLRQNYWPENERTDKN
jgi:hypothetical protein